MDNPSGSNKNYRQTGGNEESPAEQPKCPGCNMPWSEIERLSKANEQSLSVLAETGSVDNESAG